MANHVRGFLKRHLHNGRIIYNTITSPISIKVGTLAFLLFVPVWHLQPRGTEGIAPAETGPLLRAAPGAAAGSVAPGGGDERVASVAGVDAARGRGRTRGRGGRGEDLEEDVRRYLCFVFFVPERLCRICMRRKLTQRGDRIFRVRRSHIPMQRVDGRCCPSTNTFYARYARIRR